MPVSTRSKRSLSATPPVRKKRCQTGTRKNKQGVCEISKCQKELNQLRERIQVLFPKIDKLQDKVNNLGTDAKRKSD